MAQASRHEDKWRWPKWAQLALALLIVSYTVVSLDVRIERFLGDIGVPPLAMAGLGFEIAQDGPSHWQHVVSVKPGSVAAKAGLQAGDYLQFDDPLQTSQTDFVGKQISLKVDRNGAYSHHVLIPERRQAGVAGSRSVSLSVIELISLLAALGFALLILWRRWGNPAAISLGLVLFAFAGSRGYIPFWIDNRALEYLIAGFWIPYSFHMGLIPLFAFYLSGNQESRGQRRLVWAWFWLCAALFGSGLYANLTFTKLPLVGHHDLVNPVAGISVGLAFAIILKSYSGSSPEQRNRIKFVIGAFAIFMLWALAGVALRYHLLSDGLVSIVDWVMPLTLMAIVAMLAYTMIRHRLFDFGFAINRTLVFATMSFALLATFGLAEWSAEHFVPDAWHRGGPFISAGIALALFLVFHRVRDWIERQVERLFFSSWRRAESALKRFVDSAGHFDRMPKLCSAFANAAARYAQGAGVALYTRHADGAYRLAAGTLAGTKAGYDDDDPAFALMRSERGPVELAQANGELPGIWTLPMLDQGTLTGFLLLGEKPDSAQYRPDEIENLAWATHQVGLDLQALHARQLEERVRMLTARDVALSAVLEKLQPARGGA